MCVTFIYRKAERDSLMNDKFNAGALTKIKIILITKLNILCSKRDSMSRARVNVIFINLMPYLIYWGKRYWDHTMFKLLFM